jgi:hypothetical protein
MASSHLIESRIWAKHFETLEGDDGLAWHNCLLPAPNLLVRIVRDIDSGSLMQGLSRSQRYSGQDRGVDSSQRIILPFREGGVLGLEEENRL